MLPTATWYEKNDLNTSDMHPFIHPLSAAVDPAWQSRSDWEIYKGLRQEVQRGLRRPPGRREGAGADALMHDSPGELAQPFDVQDWKKGECDLIPARPRRRSPVVERDYPNVYKRFTALGPLMEQGRQRRQGHRLEHADEVRQLGELSTAWCATRA